MNSNKNSKKKEILLFVKRYLYLFVVVALFIILSVTLSLIDTNSNVVDKNTTKQEVNAGVTTFYSPLLNCSLQKDFSDTNLMYNETLKQWEAHMAIDLVASEKSNVYAVLDGKVASVYENYLEGKVVVIEHIDGLKSFYKSLDSTASLKVGDIVSKGQVIGETGLSASEAHLGNHLHFEVEKNGKKIDPSGYLNLNDK